MLKLFVKRIIKQNMKCCRYLLHQIILSFGAIHPCCSKTISKTKSQIFDNYKGEKIDMEEYTNKRQFMIDLFKTGFPPPCFKNCTVYEEPINHSNKISFDIINASHRTFCSANCIYCDLREKGNQDKRKELDNYNTYNIIPILKDIRNNNLINYNCEFFIDGGECSEYPKTELQYLILFALNNNCRLKLLSSGVKYSEIIAKALKVADINIKISTDSGKRETYEKIKRIKAFDIVWKNIAKYINDSKDNPKAVIEVKYIIIPGINDNLNEIKAFTDKCRQAGVKNIVIDIEHYWLCEHSEKDITNNLCESVKYFIDLKNKSSEFHVDYIQVGKSFLEGLVK